MSASVKDNAGVLDILADDLSDEGKAAIEGCDDAAAGAEALVGAGILQDAVLLQAAAMDAKSSLYWAWCCVDHYLSGSLDPAALRAMSAVEGWLKDPSEELAKAAWNAAQDDKKSTAASWICRGAYWSGDNVAPPDVEVVQKIPPSPVLPAKMAALAVNLCIVSDPEQADKILSYCLELAGEIKP